MKTILLTSIVEDRPNDRASLIKLALTIVLIQSWRVTSTICAANVIRGGTFVYWPSLRSLSQ